MEGILAINKPPGRTAFSLVAQLRRLTQVSCIGHAGTLDPFASGVMVLLIGRNYTRRSDHFLCQEKEYMTEVRLGSATDSYDCEGVVTQTSAKIPTAAEIHEVLKQFQGTILQVPPMFSAKKVGGKKLYELARKGKEIERQAVPVQIETLFLRYEYPNLWLRIRCSKGTYIRSIGHEIGQLLGCGAHLTQLQRTRSGSFDLAQCIDADKLDSCSIQHYLKQN